MPTLTSSAQTANRIKELSKEPFDIYDFKNLSNAGERQDASRLDELRRIYMKLIADGELTLYDDDFVEDDVKGKWNQWLSHQHSNFVDQLCDRIRLGRKHALRTFCGVIASSPIAVEKGNSNGESKTTKVSENAKSIDERLVRKLIEALCIRKIKSKSTSKKRKREKSRKEVPINERSLYTDEPMLNLLQTEFIGPYKDSQYFVLTGLNELAIKLPFANEYRVNDDDEDEKLEASIIAENILNILMRVKIVNSQDDLDNGSYLIQPPVLDRKRTKTELKEDDEDEGYDSNEETDSSDSENEEVSPKPTTDKKSRKRKVNSGMLISKSTKKKRLQKDTRLSFQKLSRHRAILGETWISCIGLPYLPLKAHKRALQCIPKAVLPVMRNPLRLADYMTKSYKIGGITAVLALNSLFILMTQHGLEYPQFFTSLYALIGPKVFYTKHRTRFFQLLTICLSKSEMIPAYVVAAFCKRLCHSALSAPPSGALFTLAFVSNLLRKHKECACLIHRGGGKLLEDVFDAEENDPSKCRAIESSLWELSSFENHYHPAVVALAKTCGKEDDKTPLYDMDEFLLHTYKSLFEQESKRRVKKTPLTFTEPKSLFTKDDLFSGILQIPS